MLNKIDDLLAGKHGKTGHFVRFYDDGELLLDEVASFLERTLRARGRGIVIATGAHVDALRARLDALERAEGRTAPASWDIQWFDAETTLARIMAGGWPDRARFEYEVGRVMAEACAGGAHVHAFGEMVALLCARGRYDAALHLERLWNELARKLDFSLFCAYPWALFPSSGVAHVFRQICAEHDHACADAAAPLPPGQPVDISLVRLEQKVHALQAEAARRRHAKGRSCCASASSPTSSRTRPRACTRSAPTAPSCGRTGPSCRCSATAGKNTSATTSPHSILMPPSSTASWPGSRPEKR